MRILFITKKRIMVVVSAMLLAVVAFFVAIFLWEGDGVKATFSETANNEVRVINLVTGEFKAELANGKEIEAYRWDPGTIFVEKDEPVKLNIYGVNGKEHPFIIEGTDVKGVVKQGEEKVLDLQFDQEGIYRLICTTHTKPESNGPMIAYIVVD